MSIKDRTIWYFMLLFGVMLIVIGVQGSLGRILACILVPSQVIIEDSGQATTPF